ncbi:MAG: hypothetical protein ACQPRJ_06420 [Solitalea-like symbiont of Acarus siro]
MMYISKKIKYLTKIIVLALAIIIFAAPQKSILAPESNINELSDDVHIEEN